MQEFTVTSPNTCGLVVLPTGLVYVGIVDAITAAPDDATFEEFLTQGDAATRATEIDPTYDMNNIYGPLYLTPVNISEPRVSADYGSSVTLNCEQECSDPAATITYQWFGPGNGLILGATSSSYTITDATATTNGTYTCHASASLPTGQTGSNIYEFEVLVTEVRGQFTLTRSGNNITTGLFSFLSGFSDTSASLEVPSVSLTISYDPVDGFKTTGSPLLAVDQAAELFIDGSYVKSFTIHPVDGTFTYNFVA